MKTFKQYINEQKENKTINLMLQDFVSGEIEDFDNTGSFIDLFDSKGKGIQKALSTFNVYIVDDNGNPFNGKGKVIKPKMTFKLSDGKSLDVELTKDNQDYVVNSAKVR